jgi:hypothetical protein
MIFAIKSDCDAIAKLAIFTRLSSFTATKTQQSLDSSKPKQACCLPKRDFT